MAVRLSVIMIHTPPAGAAKQTLSEEIVGQLIGLPGIDVTLVGPIRSLIADSTDRLTLEAIAGDVVVLDWQSPERSIADLSEIGFTGVRTAHDHDPHPPENGSVPLRRIYAFDLGRFTDAAVVVQAMLNLRDHRRVKTLSIGIAPPPKRVAQPAATPSLPTLGAEQPNSHRQQPPTDLRSNSGDEAKKRDNIPGTSSIDLDNLLDQLDELDP